MPVPRKNRQGWSRPHSPDLTTETERLIVDQRADQRARSQDSSGASLPSRPASPAGSRGPENQGGDTVRSLSYLNGIAIVVGLQIGSGIFSSPSVVINNVGSIGEALVVWVVAGIAAWTGAASFIELGTTVPLNGGIVEYLRYCYHDVIAFAAAQALVLLVKPCSSAMLSLIISEYFLKLFTFQEDPSIWVSKGIAVAAVVLITFLNCMGTRAGAGAANGFFVIKLIGIGSIILTGLAVTLTHTSYEGQTHPTSAPRNIARQLWSTTASQTKVTDSGHGIWDQAGGYADAVLAGLWAYSGWESLGYVAGELREPRRTLPKVLHSSMALVITLYALCNLAYSSVLSLKELGSSTTVAMDFGLRVFGRAGALFYSSVVCLSCLGALNSKIFTAGRLTQITVQRKYLPGFMASTSKGTNDTLNDEDHLKRSSAVSKWRRLCWPFAKDDGVPRTAMLCNLVLATFFIITGSFRVLITFIGMAEYFVLLGAAAGVLVLRAYPRSFDPQDPANIYRTGIWNPIIFCTLNLVVIFRSAIRHPFQGYVLVAFYAVSIALYSSGWWHRYFVR